MRGPTHLLPALALSLAFTSAHALNGEVLASGLSQSLYLTAPIGDSRLFVVEKTGAIQVISGGSQLSTPFLNLSDKIDTQGERGLLGLAFDPNYATNGRLYVNYIDKTTRQTIVERYTATPGSNVVDPGSAQRILAIPQESYANHKAGWIAFRPGDDNNLYIATGDGGSGNDPANNGQNPNTLLGKLLRIDVSGNTAGYTVAASNPFVGNAGVRQEIWALGLRNPWRNSFDRQTGDLWVADVGQSAREEVNFEAFGDMGGHNYGWRLREGSIPTPGVGGSAPGLTDPVFDYTRSNQPGGLGESITGGYVYRGPLIAGADGRYFFGDFVSNRVFSFLPGADGSPTDLQEHTDALLGGTGLSGLASFGEGGDGRLYLIGINGVVVAMVPEPGTWASMTAGMGLLAVLLHRRHRARPGHGLA